MIDDFISAVNCVLKLIVKRNHSIKYKFDTGFFVALLLTLTFLNSSLQKLRRGAGDKKTNEKSVQKFTKYCSKNRQQENLATTVEKENLKQSNQTNDDIQISKEMSGNNKNKDAINGVNTAGTTAYKPTKITFTSSEENFCQAVTGKNVKIICGPDTHDHGSSQVKLKNMVDYKWETKRSMGHLIAVHMDGEHVAYAINAVPGKGGMVRIVNTSRGLRALIKGLIGEVLDLQFAHIEKQKLLACIEHHSLYVHKIDEYHENLIVNPLIKIEDPLNNHNPIYDRVSWCPYIDTQSVDADDEDCKMLVWARGSTFQVFNVQMIINKNGLGNITPNEDLVGYVKHEDDTTTITYVQLSPDGTTLSVGYTDGYIRFFQIYLHDDTPRCLHQWKPHDGKPISSFFFLDNIIEKNSETYWKNAITFASNNTELKVWDCTTWTCLQTLNFFPHPSSDMKTPFRFVAEMDGTATYLVLGGIDTRVCYVLQIMNRGNELKLLAEENDTETLAKCVNDNKLEARIKTIAEFPLIATFLSFSIVDAAIRRYKCGNNTYFCDDWYDYDEDINSILCVIVRMYIVHPKSMQDCHIIYQPTDCNAVTDVKTTLDSLKGNNSLQVNDAAKAVATVVNDEAVSDGDACGGDVSGSGTSEIDIVESTPSVAPAAKSEENPSGNKLKENDNETEEEEEYVSADATAVSVKDEPESNSENGEGSEQTTEVEASVVVELTMKGISPAEFAAMAESYTKSTSPHLSSHSTSAAAGAVAGKNLNLMTPDAFNTSGGSSSKKTPDDVSSEVLNTLLMLAAGQTGAAAPATTQPPKENINLLDLVEKNGSKKTPVEGQKKFIAIDNNPVRSGSSSPSREVQEIMSLNEYDKSSYSGDEDLDDDEVDDVENVAQTAANEQNIPVQTDASSSDHTSSSSSVSKVTVADWPKAPDVKPQIANTPTVTKHSAELQNAANLISQAVHAASVGNLNTSHLPPPPLFSNKFSGSTNNLSATSSEIADINNKMNQLLGLVQQQNEQIQTLSSEISEMKKQNSATNPKQVLSEFSFKLEMQLSKLMEQYLLRYENDHKKKLAAFVQGRDAQNREFRDAVAEILTQYLMPQLGEVISKVLSYELQRNLGPLLATKIDHMQQQVQIDVAQKFATFDLMLKDNIQQVCKSKNIIDAFGKSVLVGVQSSLQAAFVESMSSTLIPAYEKSSQHMFKQLHDTFSVGIKEFMEQFESYLQQLQPMHDSTEQIINNLAGFRQDMDNVVLKHRQHVIESMQDTRKDLKQMEVILSRQMQECIRSELRKCFDNQTAALRSQANTPGPIYDLREGIKILIAQRQFNKAFHQALLANDLNLVEFTLKQVDHNSVFSPECQLEQKVLLSLIQQISADMSNHNEIKQNYLAEALLAIQPQDPIMREHAPKVLTELFRNCQIFLLNYPKSTQTSNVRMLLKAVQTFRDQF